MNRLPHRLKKPLTAGFALVLLAGMTVGPAQADNQYMDEYQNFVSTHPYIQKAVIGGGAGALAGALLGSPWDRGGAALKGALIGTGAGVGYQYLRDKGYLGGTKASIKGNSDPNNSVSNAYGNVNQPPPQDNGQYGNTGGYGNNNAPAQNNGQYGNGDPSGNNAPPQDDGPYNNNYNGGNNGGYQN